MSAAGAPVYFVFWSALSNMT